MNLEEIKKLVQLSRIDLSPEEVAKMQDEFGTILGYINQVQSAPISAEVTRKINIIDNVMREDEDTHKSGIFTESILTQAPDREGNYLKVKKIL